MAYSAKVREEVLTDLNAGRLSIGKISLKYGVSVSTIYKWKNSEIGKGSLIGEQSQESSLEKLSQKVEKTPIEQEETFEEEQTQESSLEKTTQNVTENKEEKEKLSKNEYQENLKDVIKRIADLKKQNELKKALEICNHPLAATSNIIKSQKVSILINLGRRAFCSECKEYLEQALEVCQNQEFLASQKEVIENLLEAYYDKKVMTERENKKRNVNVNEWITRIYANCADIEAIRGALVTEWEKDILLCAYYEKYNKIVGVSFIKALKKKYQEEPDKKKVLNQLMDRMVVKKNISFDIVVYSRVLKGTINFESIPIIQEEYDQKERERMKKQKTEEQVLTKKPIGETPKKAPKIPERRMIISEGQRVTPRYSQLANVNHQTVQNNTRDLLIKEVFAEEIFQIGKALYSQLSVPENRLRGVKAWDRLERLKEKSSKDKKALRDILEIIASINYISPGFIKTNEERNNQMYTEIQESEQQKVKKYGANN